MGKIINQTELQDVIRNIKSQNKTIVVTNGCFDILHIGHAKYLQKSKSFGDYLFVLLNSDNSVRKIKGETRPINTENNRGELLCALSCVDYVVIFDEPSPRDLLDKIKPDVYTKGKDYTTETLPEADIILKNKGRIEFIEFVDGMSTTSILGKMQS